MFSDFTLRALLAGFGIVLVAGPLGCFVMWRRMAYSGDTLSHAGLMGVAFGILLWIWFFTIVMIWRIRQGL